MYYYFNYACDTKETGPEYPQVQKMKPGYDLNKPNSVRALARSRTAFPEFQPDLNAFQLHPKAKLTDLISSSMSSSIGLLISDKLKTIFEEHRIVSHKFYPAKIISQGEEFNNYYWMHIISNLTNYVNYNDSKFFIYKNFALNVGYIQFPRKKI